MWCIDLDPPAGDKMCKWSKFRGARVCSGNLSWFSLCLDGLCGNAHTIAHAPRESHIAKSIIFVRREITAKSTPLGQFIYTLVVAKCFWANKIKNAYIYSNIWQRAQHTKECIHICLKKAIVNFLRCASLLAVFFMILCAFALSRVHLKCTWHIWLAVNSSLLSPPYTHAHTCIITHVAIPRGAHKAHSRGRAHTVWVGPLVSR